MALYQELESALSTLPVVRGISPADLLSMPDVIGRTLGRMVQKKGMDLKEFAAELELDEVDADRLADILVAKGYLLEEEQTAPSTPRYRVFFARMRTHHLPLDF